MSQYLYILTHPSRAGKLKIGRTIRSPQARAEELSKSEGMDTPYEVAHAEPVTHSIAAEQLAHIQLMEAGYRIDAATDCFNMPLQEAVRIVAGAAAEIRAVFPGAAGPAADWACETDDEPALRGNAARADCAVSGPPAFDRMASDRMASDRMASDRMASYRRPGVLSRWMVVARPRIARP